MNDSQTYCETCTLSQLYIKDLMYDEIEWIFIEIKFSYQYLLSHFPGGQEKCFYETISFLA